MHILVVEDEKKIAGFIKRGLREEGYVVSLASDGDEAESIALSTKIDLMVLDIMIPKKNGLQVCKSVRLKKPDLPIIILSAKDSISDKVQGLDLGANDYMTKPFAFDELLARIRTQLRKVLPVQSTLLSFEDIRMDMVSHKVFRAGNPISLTSREFSLLEYLVRHAGSIVTRTAISENVWDVHFETDTNIIDVYVNYLRKKIDNPFEQKVIHTVRGKGYRLGS